MLQLVLYMPEDLLSSPVQWFYACDKGQVPDASHSLSGLETQTKADKLKIHRQ